MKKAIARVWTFGSDSSSAIYETLQYVDGTTSCNCRGWIIKREGKERSCKHTRMVDQGIADSQCMSHKDYTVDTPKPKKKAKPKTANPQTTTKPVAGRKIQWQ